MSNNFLLSSRHDLVAVFPCSQSTKYSFKSAVNARFESAPCTTFTAWSQNTYSPLQLFDRVETSGIGQLVVPLIPSTDAESGYDLAFPFAQPRSFVGTDIARTTTRTRKHRDSIAGKHTWAQSHIPRFLEEYVAFIHYNNGRILDFKVSKEAFWRSDSEIGNICQYLFGNIWQYLAIFGNNGRILDFKVSIEAFWRSDSEIGNIWQYLFGNIWQYLAIFGNIWQYVAICGL